MRFQLFDDTTQTIDSTTLVSPYGATITSNALHSIFRAVVPYVANASVTEIAPGDTLINFVDPTIKMFDWGFIQPAGYLMIREHTAGELPFQPSAPATNPGSTYEIGYYNGRYVISTCDTAPCTLTAGTTYDVWIEIRTA